jgi:hypothetical protein
MSESAESPASVKGHCPHCGSDRWASVVAYHQSSFDDHETGIYGKTAYRILQCRGCDTVYFQTDEIFSEDQDFEFNPRTGEWEPYFPHKISYWPAPSKRSRPEWSSDLFAVDSDLSALFDDIYVALNNDLRVLSAIGVRTAFDRASELLGVDPAKTFAQKLTDLVDLGKIGSSERDTLDILTDAASAAAHRGWKPKPKELDTMMGIIEAFLYRTFILDPAAKSLKKNVPAKPKRRKP